MQQWLWERTTDGEARFVLGTVGDNPLVCFGVNPSTAKPNHLDRTVNRVASFATTHGHDSWIMLNVYPQIATDPRDMHRVHKPELAAQNERQIASVFTGRSLTLLAAWGDLIDTRDYLKPLLARILTVTNSADLPWVSLGTPTIKGHPRHPLYLDGRTALVPFDVRKYLPKP